MLFVGSRTLSCVKSRLYPSMWLSNAVLEGQFCTSDTEHINDSCKQGSSLISKEVVCVIGLFVLKNEQHKYLLHMHFQEKRVSLLYLNNRRWCKWLRWKKHLPNNHGDLSCIPGNHLKTWNITLWAYCVIYTDTP